MGKILIYFLRNFLFFLILFYLERAIFILFQFNDLRLIPVKEILSVFSHSLSMDLAAVCAILLIPQLFTSIYLFVQHKMIIKAVYFYCVFMIIITGFINICDVALYWSWGTRINSQAISYLSYPKEATANALSSKYLLLLVVFILCSYVLVKLYKKFVHGDLNVRGNIAFRILFLLMLPFILIVGIRGGFQTFPLDRSWVYFSRHSLLNQAAVNSSWNFFHALTDPIDLVKNPYVFFPETESNKILKKIYNVVDNKTVQILNTNQPNIILIMLESFSAEAIEPLGGRKNITPNLTALCAEGLLFTNFYTPGFRTEQGLAALVSGFPSQPRTTIIRQFGKFDKLPSLARTLDSAGYHSSYYYGGNLHFAFTGSYLQAAGFDKIIGEDDFEIKKRTDWGAYDEEVFSLFNKEMKNSQQPFFSIIMTSTNHEPFDADVEKIHESNPGDWCGDYINTVHYTDRCIGEFVAELKKQSWYDNTLVAIVADHAHICPEKYEYNSAPRHRIPFLLLGGALKNEYKGNTEDKISSQVDFAATILSMLNINHNHFPWSKNIFDSTSPEFAFYSFDDGFGMVTPVQNVLYDHKLKHTTKTSNNSHLPVSDSILNVGKAHLQQLMYEYIKLSEGG